MRSNTDTPEAQKAYETILAQLIRERVKQKMTKTQLAHRLGVKPSYVCKIESKAIVPRMDRTAQIADILGCELKLHKKRTDRYKTKIDYEEEYGKTVGEPIK